MEKYTMAGDYIQLSILFKFTYGVNAVPAETSTDFCGNYELFLFIKKMKDMKMTKKSQGNLRRTKQKGQISASITNLQ